MKDQMHRRSSAAAALPGFIEGPGLPRVPRDTLSSLALGLRTTPAGRPWSHGLRVAVAAALASARPLREAGAHGPLFTEVRGGVSSGALCAQLWCQQAAGLVVGTQKDGPAQADGRHPREDSRE